MNIIKEKDENIKNGYVYEYYVIIQYKMEFLNINILLKTYEKLEKNFLK
jgi:hypothetical protein